MILWQDTTYHKAIALQKAHLLKNGISVFYGHGFMMSASSAPPPDVWQYVTEFEFDTCWWAYVWMMKEC